MSESPETSARGGEERLAGIAGDRFCVGCGYNLLGQSVVREPHYGLLIVRCPECGAVSSVVEYPPLARWSRALGAVLMALWLIFMLFASGMTFWALAGFSLVTAEATAGPYEAYLQNAHAAAVDRDQREAAAKKAAPEIGDDDGTDDGEAGDSDGDGDGDGGDGDGDGDGGDGEAGDGDGGAPAAVQTGNAIVVGPVPLIPAIPGNPQAQLWQDFARWWKLQDHAAVLAGAGGLRAVINPRGFFVLIPAAIVLFLLGCFWTVAMIFARRRWLVGWMLFIGLFATFIVGAQWWAWMTREPDWYWHAARAEVGVRLIWPLLAINAVPFIVGLLLGRPAVRLLVRGLLPPRWRGPLAFLWIASGKTVPGTRR